MTSEFSSPPPQPSRGPVTVSALNRHVSQVLERNFPLLWISGEISNMTRAASGHWYFTLKDDAAQVRAVMFRGRAQYVDFQPKEGDRVEVRALVTLYAPRGDYQLNVEAMRRAGVGNLYEAFLQLKAKLEKEGLFDPAHKQEIPAFVRTIGIVTSPKAAALRDILTTLRRRAPHARIILYPAPVQGEGAGHKIAEAIRTAAARNECDVLLVCRGGGSIEDLWSFNEEVVARAIATCPIPVISGVGHETDFTIADFVADLRAPTPTAAAEMAARSRQDWLLQLEGLAAMLARRTRQQLRERQQRVDLLAHRLVSPDAYIRQERTRLAHLQTRLAHALQRSREQAGHRLHYARSRLQAQASDTAAQRQHINALASRLQRAAQLQVRDARQHVTSLQSQLTLLGPQQTLDRGYAIITGKNGLAVRQPADLLPNSTVSVRMARGEATVGISHVQQTLDATTQVQPDSAKNR